MAEVTISSQTADRLPQIASEEVRKILDSDEGLEILSDAFFTSAHIAFVTKSNGGVDEFGDKWAELAPRTLTRKKRARTKALQTRARFPEANRFEVKAWWNIDRRNAWQRNRRNLLRQLVASGMSPDDAKIKATSMAWGSVTATSGVSINVESGDLEEALMKDSKNPDQVSERRGDSYVMGTSARTAEWCHDGSLKKNRPARPVIPEADKVTRWIERGAHVVALKARQKLQSRLRRNEARRTQRADKGRGRAQEKALVKSLVELAELETILRSAL